MAKRDELVKYLDEALETEIMKDYSNNGLQVQGKDEVTRIGLATDAALAVYEKAAQMKCDMIITHHGLIWGGIQTVTGRDYQHIKFLVTHEINLYASHLPLDAHPDLGNNAELCRMVGLENREPFGFYHGITLGFKGTLPLPMTLNELAEVWHSEIGGKSFSLPFGPEKIKTVGIVSGGGGSVLTEAIASGLDCFVTGEGKHEDHHLALEGKTNVLYLGHYHSETAGVKAVGRKIAQHFNIDVVFIDEPTIL